MKSVTQIKHEYLRSRAYIRLSLSSPFSPVTVSQIWPLSRYSCFYLGSLHPRNFVLKAQLVFRWFVGSSLRLNPHKLSWYIFLKKLEIHQSNKVMHLPFSQDTPMFPVKNSKDCIDLWHCKWRDPKWYGHLKSVAALVGSLSWSLKDSQWYSST